MKKQLWDRYCLVSPRFLIGGEGLIVSDEQKRVTNVACLDCQVIVLAVHHALRCRLHLYAASTGRIYSEPAVLSVSCCEEALIPCTLQKVSSTNTVPGVCARARARVSERKRTEFGIMTVKNDNRCRYNNNNNNNVDRFAS